MTLTCTECKAMIAVSEGDSATTVELVRAVLDIHKYHVCLERKSRT